MRQILSSPEFQSPTSGSNSLGWLSERLRQAGRYVSRQWDNFWGFVRRMFRFRASVASGVSEVFVYIFIVLFLVGTAWMLARVVRTWIYRDRAASASTTKSVSVEQEEAVTEPDLWLQQAREYAAQQDYRRAFRAVFVATLLRLNRAGVIEYQRSRTNGDYLRMLRARTSRGLYDTFLPFSVEFDLRWYGDRQTRETDYQRGLQAYQEIIALINTQGQPGGSQRSRAQVAAGRGS